MVRRLALAMIFFFWVTQFTTLTLMRYLRSPDEVLASIIPRAIMAAAGITLSLGIFYIQGRARSASLTVSVSIAIFLAIAGCAIHGTINELVMITIYDSEFTGADFILSVLGWIWFYFSISLMILVISHSADIVNGRIQIEALRAQATTAQLAALRYQLNPHFLFNTLNSISALVVDKETDRAERMINRLSDFLRAGLEGNALEEVPLSEEIVQQRRYLEIEQVRFSNRFTFDIDIRDEMHDALVPSLILQPLVENAIKYGVAPSREPVKIQIIAERVGGDIRIRVRDDACADNLNPNGTGIGLNNVRERLASFFGAAASIEAAPLDGGGYQVSLQFPWQRAA